MQWAPRVDHGIVGPPSHRGNLYSRDGCRSTFAASLPTLPDVPTPSYLLSFVAIQALRLGPKFPQRYGGAWLVWEPGAWQPPSRSLVNTMGSTGGGQPTTPTHTDALCFHLGDEGHVKVGRAPDNECVVSDATVSRHHLELFTKDGAWWVRPAEGRQVTLNGQVLRGAFMLTARDKLQLGDVTLTFDDVNGLLARTQP